MYANWIVPVHICSARWPFARSNPSYFAFKKDWVNVQLIVPTLSPYAHRQSHPKVSVKDRAHLNIDTFYARYTRRNGRRKPERQPRKRIEISTAARRRSAARTRPYPFFRYQTTSGIARATPLGRIRSHALQLRQRRRERALGGKRSICTPAAKTVSGRKSVRDSAREATTERSLEVAGAIRFASTKSILRPPSRRSSSTLAASSPANSARPRASPRATSTRPPPRIHSPSKASPHTRIPFSPAHAITPTFAR